MLSSQRSTSEGVVAQWCNPLTLKSEQSGREGHTTWASWEGVVDLIRSLFLQSQCLVLKTETSPSPKTHSWTVNCTLMVLGKLHLIIKRKASVSKPLQFGLHFRVHFTIKMSNNSNPVCIKDLEEFAKKTLPRNAYDYYSSGADDQQTLQENINAYKRYIYIH